jgi:hypothetical protein
VTSMTLIHIKETGHVVAGLTRDVNPGASVDVAALVGDSFAYRTSATDPTVPIPADQLDATVKDFSVEVLQHPGIYMLLLDEDPVLLAQIPTAGSSVVSGLTLGVTGLLQFVVTHNPALVTDPVKIWAAVIGEDNDYAGAQSSSVTFGDPAAPASPQTITLQFDAPPSGTYHLLVAVQRGQILHVSQAL